MAFRIGPLNLNAVAQVKCTAGVLVLGIVLSLGVLVRVFVFGVSPLVV